MYYLIYNIFYIHILIISSHIIDGMIDVHPSSSLKSYRVRRKKQLGHMYCEFVHWIFASGKKNIPSTKHLSPKRNDSKASFCRTDVFNCMD